MSESKMNVALEIKNLSKSFGNKQVLSDVNLTVCEGEIHGFIGHNGAGKSTTIKHVVGILPVESGSVKVCGCDIMQNPVQCKKNMAYVPDNPDIYEFLTGIQYLNFIADIFQVDPNKRDESIETFAKRLQIENALGEQISAYSHGMRQKLVIISALIHEPKLLVLDEPFVGLDPIASHEIKEILKEITQKGAAVFFSSHVLEVVEKLCDKVSIIRGGKILKSGTTQSVVGDETLEEVFLELATQRDDKTADKKGDLS